MKTYRLFFVTNGDICDHRIEAQDEQQAQVAARKWLAENWAYPFGDLSEQQEDFEEMLCDNTDTHTWVEIPAEELAQERVRDAAPDLLAAGKAVIAAWERGDLAAAVRQLADAIALAEPVVSDPPEREEAAM